MREMQEENIYFPDNSNNRLGRNRYDKNSKHSSMCGSSKEGKAEGGGVRHKAD